MQFDFDLADINKAATRFWSLVGDKKLIAFHAAMGAGKTTFIHALCDVKKVTSAVSSPTFSVINEYSYPGGIIYHIDLYRLDNEAEAVRAGVEDCLFSNSICLVEWPEKAPALFPDDCVHVYLKVKDTNVRSLQISNI